MHQVPEIKPTPAQLVSRMRELTTLPDIYARVKATLDNPVSSHEDIAQSLSTDPTLTARLLRMANSAFYGRPGKIATVTRAVGLLGTQQIHDLVLATAVLNAFGRVKADGIDHRSFWHTSVAAAAAAKVLADHCDILDSERLFVNGLLARTGLLILHQELPVSVREAASAARQSGRPTSALQREQLGFDYAELSAVLFESWQLPQALVTPIRFHTQPAMADEFELEAAILHVAVGLAEAEEQNTQLEPLIAQLDDAAWQLIGLSVETLTGIAHQATELTKEIAPALLNAAA